MNTLIVHKVDITHYRLVELSKLADQSKPFYDWIERTAKKLTNSHKDLSEILMAASKEDIKSIILECYGELEEKRPLLFDGIGRVYSHGKACFFFFAWIIRDAPQQRLAPLISQMRQVENLDKIVAEIDTLVELIVEYRKNVKGFTWIAIREIVIDRLEGSRRSIKGHRLESGVRTAVITAFQNYYSIYGNYGKYKSIRIAEKQIKIGSHTIDVSVELTLLNSQKKEIIIIPIKSRETEGGGHSHLFSRDILAAVSEITKSEIRYYIIAVVVAVNWSTSELETIDDQINKVYYFNLNPNNFMGFDDETQIDLNRYIKGILSNEC